MAITPDQRNHLEAGTKLWAKYKGQVYTASVISLADDNGNETKAFKLDPDGTEYKSISGLGSAVRGGKATNGWAFWSIGVPMTLDQEPKPAKAKRAKREPARKANGEVLPIVEQVDGSFECGNCSASFPTADECKAHLDEAHPVTAAS